MTAVYAGRTAQIVPAVVYPWTCPRREGLTYAYARVILSTVSGRSRHFRRELPRRVGGRQERVVRFLERDDGRWQIRRALAIGNLCQRVDQVPEIHWREPYGSRCEVWAASSEEEGPVESARAKREEGTAEGAR